jgi:hypothetical protein
MVSFIPTEILTESSSLSHGKVRYSFKTSQMNAKVSYNSGLMLTIQKSGNSPMLFLEWLATRRPAINTLHHVIDDSDKNVFKIRMNCIKNTFIECRDYINSNL